MLKKREAPSIQKLYENKFIRSEFESLRMCAELDLNPIQLDFGHFWGNHASAFYLLRFCIGHFNGRDCGSNEWTPDGAASRILGCRYRGANLGSKGNVQWWANPADVAEVLPGRGS